MIDQYYRGEVRYIILEYKNLDIEVG